MNFKRAWDGDGWQAYALQLVQIRHRPQNVQAVPDKVKGDAGIEFFTTDGCLYQCYAPEEASDVAKASSAMKAKASRDLKKLHTYASLIERILQDTRCNRWILLCPFLDDKDVVAFVREKGKEIQSLGLSFLEQNFEALVHCQTDFSVEIGRLKQMSAGMALHFERPSQADVQAHPDGEMTRRLVGKLSRAFPEASPAQIEDRKNSYIRAHLIQENALHEMRDNHPILWEQSKVCIDAEETRLRTIGSGSGAASDQLQTSVNRIEESLRRDLPSVSASVVTEIAVGTISDWLLRCPLDFPEDK
jgi:hypothetical protein